MSAAPRPIFIASIVYRDNRAALAWLRDAFGFDVSEVLTDSKGNIVHAEMSHDEGVIMISPESSEWLASPASLGGKNTQRLHVRLHNGIDEHCEQARKSGARIVMEPADMFYGERSYVAADHEGHYWTFSQFARHVSNEEMERATGFRYVPFE
jgi:uncharacterized glyoxalase superfamily protein PhnB